MSSTADTDDVVEVSAEGLTVRKRFTADEFPVPAIRFEIESDRDEPVSFRLSEQIPPSFPMDSVGFHPEYHSDDWTAFQDHHVEFAGTAEPGETFVTVYGIRVDDETDVSQFLSEPSLAIGDAVGEESAVEADDESEDDETAEVDDTMIDDIIGEDRNGVVKDMLSGDAEAVPGLEPEDDAPEAVEAPSAASGEADEEAPDLDLDLGDVDTNPVDPGDDEPVEETPDIDLGFGEDDIPDPEEPASAVDTGDESAEPAIELDLDGDDSDEDDADEPVALGAPVDSEDEATTPEADTDSALEDDDVDADLESEDLTGETDTGTESEAESEDLADETEVASDADAESDLEDDGDLETETAADLEESEVDDENAADAEPAGDDTESAGDAASEPEPPAEPAEPAEPVGVRLAAEIRAGDLEDDDLEVLRSELDLEPAGTDLARIEHLQSRIEEIAAYTAALEEFLDEEGTGQQLIRDFDAEVEAFRSDLEAMDDRLEETETRVDEGESRTADLESDLEATDELVSDLLEDVDDLDSGLEAVGEDLDAVDERVDDVEDDLEAVSEDVAEITEWRSELGSMFSN